MKMFFKSRNECREWCKGKSHKPKDLGPQAETGHRWYISK